MDALKALELTARVTQSLRQIGAVGARGAANALSQLTGQEISISMPIAVMLPLVDLPDLFSPRELQELCVAVYVPFEGDAAGSLALLLRGDQAQTLLSLMGLPVEGDFDEMHLSALREVGNIVASAYLNALADLANMTILPSPPGLAHETIAAIIGSVAAQAMLHDEYGLVVQVRMSSPDHRLTPDMIMLPRPAALAAILSKLEASLDEAA